VDNNHLIVVDPWLQINLAQCAATQQDVPKVNVHHNFVKAQEHP